MNARPFLDHTVTSFISSEAGRQLSTRRVLFYITDRLNNYNCEDQRVIQQIMPPISVALCPTSFCVRQCVFCSNTTRNIENRRIGAEYSERVFNEIIEDLVSLRVRGLSIAGGGEPLVYNKSGLNRLLALPNPPFKIGIHTNGVLLDKVLTPEVLGAANIQYINISVLAHNASLYGKITGGSPTQFERIEENIRRAVSLAQSHPRFPTFGVKLLINRENYNQIKEIRDYFANLGVQNVLLRCVGNFEPGQDVELTVEQYAELRTILKEIFGLPDEQIRAITGASNDLPPNSSRCWIMALQYTAGIDPDGEVYLCSPWSQKTFSIGNVNHVRFRDIWGSERHLRIAGQLSEQMQRCRCNPLLCRHYYSNLAIEGCIAGKIEPLVEQDIESSYGRFI